MSKDHPTAVTAADWRAELPRLSGRTVLLREPAAEDAQAVLSLLSAADASRFGVDEVTLAEVQGLIERAARDRANGTAFTFAITAGAAHALVGLLQVRQLDPMFEAAEWECTIAPAARGTGMFIEAVRLTGAFAFGTVGAHRLEARVALQNGRANGALRKVGAVQEGILRRSLRRGSEYIDQVLWAMLKEDWRDQRAQSAPSVH